MNIERCGCRTICSEEDVKKVALKQLKMNKEKEKIFILLALDTKNRILDVFEVYRVGLTPTIVTPRKMFINLVLCNATSFVCVHIHTSGDVTPSYEDKNIASGLQEWGDLLQIKLLDFCIVKDNEIYSFKKEKLI